MKAVVAAFNQEKALLRDYEPSDGPSFQALVKALHVVLLEECMMLLQKQGDKFLLKFHSSSASQAASGKEESRY